MEEALRFANACGAICTTAVGAGTALCSRGQVLELLGLIGVIVDPTTTAPGDSERAMGYEEPRVDEK
jgi:uncharacterized membrane protein